MVTNDPLVRVQLNFLIINLLQEMTYQRDNDINQQNDNHCGEKNQKYLLLKAMTVIFYKL